MLGKSLKKLDTIVTQIEEWTLFIIVMAALLSLFANVILRYGFNYTLAWSEELVRIVIIYSTFVGASVAVNQRAMIKIDAIVQIFPRLKPGLTFYSNILMLSEEYNKKAEELTSNSNDVTKGGNEVTGSTQVAETKSAEKAKQDDIKNRANSSSASALKEAADKLKAEAGKTAKAIGESIATNRRSAGYFESNNTAGNIYNLDMTKIERNGDEIICKPEDTIVRINNMKAGLMFQPAFFSGDKIDFVRKVEFLSKLTRPSENNSDTGFSFTKPPISHIRLGDWWDHDIVVNSVSYDYSDAPWTLDGGRVQPMWVKVTLSFNIIGPYGSASSRPPLSTDDGGMYS